MKQFVWRLVKTVIFLIVFFIVGAFGPKEIKESNPYLWGWLEGKTGWDMTGFYFSPWIGDGHCRIENSIAAFRNNKSKILFGMVTTRPGKMFPHLWVVKDEVIIDTVCPITDPDCCNRRIFAIVDPVTLKLEYEKPVTATESYQIKWTLVYLAGLKRALGA